MLNCQKWETFSTIDVNAFRSGLFPRMRLTNDFLFVSFNPWILVKKWVLVQIFRGIIIGKILNLGWNEKNLIWMSINLKMMISVCSQRHLQFQFGTEHAPWPFFLYFNHFHEQHSSNSPQMDIFQLILYSTVLNSNVHSLSSSILIHLNNHNVENNECILATMCFRYCTLYV